MADVDDVRARSHSPTLTSKPAGGRQRVISSCLTCRRRKVKCDHTHPICGSCTRGNHVCTWTDQPPLLTGPVRVSKPAKTVKNSDVQARLDKLEMLLERAVGARGADSSSPQTPVIKSDTNLEPESQSTPSSASRLSFDRGVTSDDGDGTLLLNGGKSQFVSSLHYALLAEEIQDIKVLLGNSADEEKKQTTQSSLVDLLSLGRAAAGQDIKQLLPSTREHHDILLEIYFTNVDPMVRIMHKQTILRKFTMYVDEAHPIAFAIFFSAINCLPPKVVQSRFGETKDTLLDRFQLGVETSLARENYLTTSSLEIFQGFVLWLTCITKEEDMGKAWALLGIAFRIALNQGLHRDPSLFPVGSMDAVTIESRRRVWHQLGYLEFRAAECKGQEPSISEDFYTTLFPRNVDDEDLVDGMIPGPEPYREEKFTSITFQLVRYMGMQAMRRIVQSTYRLERRMLDSGLQGTSRPDPAQELQNLYQQIKVMLDEFHEEMQRKYVRYLDREIPIQRLTSGLASLLEWRCYLIFWLRIPRMYRDVVFSNEIRKSIFEKSVRCIETINTAATDVDAARFQWHIGGIASFQAIMHILSELRTPFFDIPDRQRALRALQMSRILRASNDTKIWQALRNMIDKAVTEYSISSSTQCPTSASYVSAAPSSTFPTTFQSEIPSNNDIPIYSTMNTIPTCALEPAPDKPIQNTMPLQIQPHPDLSQPLRCMQDQNALCWDDINISNINNIVRDAQPTEGLMPDFDFGFWGDPFNYENEPAAMPIQDNFFPQWTG